MIVADAALSVQTSGDIKSAGFSIKASAKAFEILSSGLYSDKIRAIIRELSTNAADSHVAAGQARKFDVHLPGRLEPWFAVTDYGTGLSDDAVMTTYTTYFDSDKTGSNDFTGCLGLGSKSPFAYTDSFTVESRYAGVKRTYTAYLSPDRTPAIAKLGEEPTDEHSGLTVRFPVRQSDFSEFSSKAVDTLQWFTNRPVLAGLNYPEADYLYKTDWYGIQAKFQYASQVIMGNVAYPLDCLPGMPGTLVNHGVNLWVSIGDVNMAASREKLSYDKKTVAFLKARLADVMISARETALAEITSSPDEWTARSKLFKLNTPKLFGDAITVNYAGQLIKDYVSAKAEQVDIRYGRGGNPKSVKKYAIDRLPANGYPVYVNDAKHAYARIRHAHGTGKTVYLLPAAVPGVPAIPVSTLPLPERQAGGGTAIGRAAKAKVYAYTGTGTAPNSWWKPAGNPVNGVYVVIDYFLINGTSHPSNVREKLRLLKDLTGKDVTLYGVRKKDIAAVAGLKSLEEYTSEALKANDSLRFKYHAGQEAVHLQAHLSHGYNKILKSLGLKLLDGLAEAEKHAKCPKVTAWAALRTEPDNHDEAALLNKLYDAYPLLEHVSWYGDKVKSAVADYIRSKDESDTGLWYS